MSVNRNPVVGGVPHPTPSPLRTNSGPLLLSESLDLGGNTGSQNLKALKTYRYLDWCTDLFLRSWTMVLYLSFILYLLGREERGRRGEEDWEWGRIATVNGR